MSKNKITKEEETIQDRLDPGETIIFHARQSRIKPGGAAIITPNTIFVTEKRVIIRNPTRLGLGENIEEYFYHQITDIRLEKGLFSASLIFAIPGMTEISKNDRKMVTWGRSAEGVIDAIPKEIAEEMYKYIRNNIKNIKITTSTNQDNFDSQNPLTVLKLILAKGEITEDEYQKIKRTLD